VSEVVEPAPSLPGRSFIETAVIKELRDRLSDVEGRLQALDGQVAHEPNPPAAVYTAMQVKAAQIIVKPRVLDDDAGRTITDLRTELQECEEHRQSLLDADG